MFKFVALLALFVAVMGQNPPDKPETLGAQNIANRVLRQAPGIPGNPMPNMNPGNFGMDNIPIPDPKEWIQKGQDMMQDAIKIANPTGRRRRNV